MSDEELDDARKLVSSDHSKGCDMRYAACKCGYEASLEAAVPYLIARLDAAERDRDALREALAMLANIAEQYVLEVDGAQKRGASWYTQGASGLYQQVMLWSGRMRATIDRARAALTANHSAPVVEE